MRLFVTFRYRDIIEQTHFDWLTNGDNQHIAIAIDPDRDPGGLHCNYRGHTFHFSPPADVTVQQPQNWRSLSSGSQVLYPFWWQSDERSDIACIIVPPRAKSSHHFHRQTIERFGCVHNDDGTVLKVAGQNPLVIHEDIDVPIGASHFIHRQATRGFSVHLLRMTGPGRFPDRSDHFSKTKTAVLMH